MTNMDLREAFILNYISPFNKIRHLNQVLRQGHSAIEGEERVDDHIPGFCK